MSLMFERRRFASLDCIYLPGDPSAEQRRLMVMLHGYGANAADLAGLAKELQGPPGTHWVFPEGILFLGGTRDMPARAWWQIDHEALERAMATGAYREMRSFVVPGEPREAIRELLEACHAEFGVDFSETVLGGFSQGAMLATDVSLRSETSPRALLVLSGTLLDAEHWRLLSANHAGLRYFMSHGRADPLLDFQRAQDLKHIFDAAGLNGEWHAFEGEHEIPASLLGPLQEFLNERLA